MNFFTSSFLALNDTFLQRHRISKTQT